MATSTSNGAALGFENKLWAAADQLRGHMDPSDYKHTVLGLIFLKYISDAFQEIYDDLATRAPTHYTDPEDPDEYAAQGAFWVPPAARWQRLQDNAKQSHIGTLIDEAMIAIEKANPPLKGVLATDYGRSTLNKQRLGQLIDLIGTIGLGDADSRSKDVLGRVYEYFLGRFAAAEGKRGGQFYTPQAVVKLLVAMLEPYQGRVYDPCCGSGGMFVQSQKFVQAHGGRRKDLAIYGQESNPTTWKLCKMNLAIRGISGNIGPHNADSFLNDRHPDLRADYILANPPFNMKEWGADRLQEDVRFSLYGMPPKRNANYGWIQHIIHHLAPNGRAGFVLANGAMSTQTKGEGEVRQKIIEADLVECMVALPGQLFYTTQIPVCLWFLAKQKPPHRRGQTLFIDGRNLGHMVDRTLRALSDDDIDHIATTYHNWRAPATDATTSYADIPGYCATAPLAAIQAHDYVLTPGRYVGFAEAEDDDEPFEQKMGNLIETLEEQFLEAKSLEKTIRENMQLFKT